MAGYSIKAWGFTPEVSMLLGTLIGALLGLIFGWLAIRRQGIYFSMITLALAQMLFFVALQAKFTGGEDGLQGVARGKLFGVLDLSSDLTMYYVALIIVVLAFCSSCAPSIRLSARCSRPSRRTSRAPFLWAMTSTASSCWPS